jgi:S1-C subfamily serine protease
MNLNTQQIVLLCLLVAFVTSISTGITVVSLMDQTDEPVTQTINRIVEKTVQTVTEPSNNKPTNKEIVTVVVNQEDLTIDAVSKNSKSLVRIYSAYSDKKDTIITLGVAVSGTQILVDKNMLNKSSEYIAVTTSGEYKIKFVSGSEGGEFALYTIKDGQSVLTPANFSDSNSLQLAQSVISISGLSNNTVSTGIIEQLNKEGETVKTIDTNLNSSGLYVGSILLNLKGLIVGFKTYNLNLIPDSFAPSNAIRDYLSSKQIKP